MKALYIICNNKDIDLVGHNVYNYLVDNYEMNDSEIRSDLAEIKEIKLEDGNQYYLMITDDHVMHNAEKYLDFLQKEFNDIEAVIHVNYHEGDTAPDPILSVHHVGDITSGTYLNYNPKYATNLLVNMEKLRQEESLMEFTCESETTHYSGVVTGTDPKILLEWPVNNIDLEIGSTKESFSNPKAVEIITKTMFKVFEDTNDKRINVLYLGGAHFEGTYTRAILNEEYPIYLSHQLCGLWLMQTDYENTIKEQIKDIVEKSEIDYDAIVFHEKVKKLRPYLDELSQELNIPVFKYNALKNISTSAMKDLF